MAGPELTLPLALVPHERPVSVRDCANWIDEEGQ